MAGAGSIAGRAGGGRAPAAESEEPTWPSAEPTEAQRPVPMPSGYSPKRGRTTS